MLALLLAASACVSVPTPSGRPELRVRLEPTQAKQRIANDLSVNGWIITASDDLGVTATLPVSPDLVIWVGQGNWLSRFMLTPITGGTQIRAACHLYTTSQSQDVSSAKQGLGTQQMLEQLFRDVMIDGPYIKPGG